MEAKIDELIQKLTLEEKAALCSGADTWHTRAVERLGIPAIRVTDGPHGVRRPYEDDQGNLPANSYPTASAMAATWNEELMRQVAVALGAETKAKGCDILLGPAVNIHRTPLCGRNFEYFSEDPYLAGRLAVSYIQGIQSQNVGTSIKHFACNNQEFERFTISSELDERALREIYLPAFQMAVEEAQPWTVMCSYNKINGTWASENPYLLTDILKKEWGFDGFVISDWGAVHHRINAFNAGMDLEMPGIGDLPVEILVNAVRNGQIAESTLDEAVRRVLRIVFKARSDGQERKLDVEASNTPENRRLARVAAGEAIVLLKNEDDVLPLQPGKVRSLAVIGPNAATARIQGGGSAQVNPYYTVSPLEAIQARSGSSIKVEYTEGCKNHLTPPVLDSQYVLLPGSATEHGFQAQYFDNSEFSGEPFLTRVEQVLRYAGRTLPAEKVKSGNLSARWQGSFQAPVTGDYRFTLTSGGRSRMLVDGQMVVDHWTDPDIEQFWSVWPFRPKYGTIRMEAGKTYELVIEYQGHERLVAGYEIPLAEDENERVTAIASKADVALVFVGTTYEHETEGRDRPDWNLPGDQVALIRRVAAANPRTVVVLNNGAPVEMASWIKSVAGVVEAWYGGQEVGNAIADVLFGDVNPSGKLPETLPRFYQDTPAFINYPGENGKVLYGEGIFVGYRYYDAKDIEPLFPFGFGLSYTRFEYANLKLSATEIAAGGSLEVSVDVRNVGTRAGKEIVQLYVRDPESRLVRPPKELKGFRKVALEPGETKTVTFTLTEKELAYYDPALKRWVAEAGVFEVLVGSSSRDIRASGKFTLVGQEAPRPRLNEETRLHVILADPQGRAVLEKHIPELVNHPQSQRAMRATLRMVSLTYMELLPPEKLQAITADLARIP